MGNIVKLANAGESVTWHIAKAETAAGNFGPQVKFESSEGEILYLPADSAERQLSRIPLTVGECVGETLVISRDANPKPGAKPYWGIKLAGAADKAPPSKRVQPPSGISKGAVPGLDDEGLPPEPPEYDDEPYASTGKAPTPHRVDPVAPNAQKKAAYINAYFDLLGYVKAHSGLKDEVAIQAATATLHIGLKQDGLR